jgi:hypothetical protein
MVAFSSGLTYLQRTRSVKHVFFNPSDLMPAVNQLAYTVERLVCRLLCTFSMSRKERSLKGFFSPLQILCECQPFVSSSC